ncbi:MAG TPA: DUF4404 family protein [Gemmataceae bacterium]|nr:DUF4404 family protein [Gemmataceae bacterium]
MPATQASDYPTWKRRLFSQENIMAEQLPSKASIPPEVQASLVMIGRLLREAHHLGPEAQQTLAGLMDELGRALSSSQASSEELAHLTESTAKLVEAVHQQHDEGVLAAARDRLEEAVIAAEARAPVVAGVARRLLDALSNLGI